MQISQRKYEETRSRIEAQRVRQEKQKQQGTALQRIAGNDVVRKLYSSIFCCPSLILCYLLAAPVLAHLQQNACRPAQ